MQNLKLPPVNQTCFSAAEIKTYKEQLKRQHGAISKAVRHSGLSEQTFVRAMRGEPIKKDTQKKIVASIMKVIANIQKQSA